MVMLLISCKYCNLKWIAQTFQMNLILLSLLPKIIQNKAFFLSTITIGIKINCDDYYVLQHLINHSFYIFGLLIIFQILIFIR